MDYASLQPEELIRICIHTGHASAWEEFIRRFNPLIARVVVRTARRWGGSSRSVLDDLVQETYLKLCAENCRLLRTFESRQADAIYGYLKVVTTNVVHDHFKAAHAAKRGAGEPTKDLEIQEIDSVNVQQTTLSSQASLERDILLKEIDHQLIRSVPPDDLQRSRLIFWLYYRSGMTASAIASLPHVGLSTKGVESVLLRLTRSVRRALAGSASDRTETEQNPFGEQKGKGIRQAESF
jgi:RNA polymerase sigma-70 factor (ECF subfamily)